MKIFVWSLLIRRGLRESNKQLSRIADSLEKIAAAVYIPAPDTEIEITSIDKVRSVSRQREEALNQQKIPGEPM